MSNTSSTDIDFLKQFSKLRVLQQETNFTATDLKHLLTGYCVFDSNRVRYRLVKKKKVAVIGVVCFVENEFLHLSSLTKSQLLVSTEGSVDYKIGEVLLIFDPLSTCSEGNCKLEIGADSKVISVGKSVDFGICCYKDQKSQSCSEVVNTSIGPMCETHAKAEFEILDKAIARRQELGGASVYNALRFNYTAYYKRSGRGDLSVDRCLGKRKKPFYDKPGFEQEVEEMPDGKEKSHLEALLKRVKPKQMKTMQEQMEEHLIKKKRITSDNEIHEAKVQDLKKDLTHLTPQKPPKIESEFVLLESVEPRPSATEIDNLIFSLKKATQEFSEIKDLQCNDSIKDQESQSSLIDSEITFTSEELQRNG